jgi:hypothetical protein
MVTNFFQMTREERPLFRPKTKKKSIHFNIDRLRLQLKNNHQYSLDYFALIPMRLGTRDFEDKISSIA